MSLKAQGTPVIFSTHHLDEVGALCDKVVVIDKGLSSFSGTLEQFKQLAPHGDLRQAFLAVIANQPQQGVA
jgi:sodium transport system ATP-binding protein